MVVFIKHSHVMKVYYTQFYSYSVGLYHTVNMGTGCTAQQKCIQYIAGDKWVHIIFSYDGLAEGVAAAGSSSASWLNGVKGLLKLRDILRNFSWSSLPLSR